MLARIDQINTGITRLTEVIERLLAPYEEQLQQAESMPGWGRRAAQDALAETGTDMSRFRTGAHLASWAAEMIHYGMTKAAQIAVARGLAEATAGTGITVNSVLPGPTRSRGVGDFVADWAAKSGKSAQNGGG